MNTATGETEVSVAGSASGQTTKTVETPATDEPVKSMTEDDLGDRKKTMDVDQTGGPKETILETTHFSPFGHEATPSSSLSKIDPVPDVSPIMPTKKEHQGLIFKRKLVRRLHTKPQLSNINLHRVHPAMRLNRMINWTFLQNG